MAAVVASVTANDRMAVSAFLADGLSVEAADSAGWTLLHLAARANAADVAQLLLVRVCGAARPF
jgi:ankyrin repeat protein